MKLTFKSTDRYFIDVDSIGNHTLTENKVSDKGKKYIKQIGHYQSVRQAVEKLAKLNVIEQSESMEVLEYVQAVEEEFKRLIGDVVE